ncbi:MAG: pyridoxamine 5'-phosphate oxidase family protein [Chloroflexota bacterium]
MNHTKTKEQKIVEMIDEHETVMFVTHNEETGDDAELIEDIERNNGVNLAYQKEGNFVSISGTASMVDDTAKKKELWYPELKKWFDGAGPESPTVKLIKVSATTAHYWTSPNGRFDDDSKNDGGSPVEHGTVNY